MTDPEVLHSNLGIKVQDNAPRFIIFSKQLSKRLDYVCSFIFNHVLNCHYTITNQVHDFETSNDRKVNYTNDPISHSLQIVPHALLFEKGVSSTLQELDIVDNKPYLFLNNHSHCLSFDIFSAVFYSISRYEEWQDFKADEHGRFELKQSIFFNKGFHLMPVVDHWVLQLKQELNKLYPQLKFPEKAFKTIATIDVDNLFAFRDKGLIRTGGAFCRDLLKWDLTNIKRRLNVLKKKEKDPFDIYHSFSKFCTENRIPLFYFFLFRNGTKYDRTVDINSPHFSEAFEQIKLNNAEIGIHPSYYSSSDPVMLKNEVKLISEKTGFDVRISRQHYLRFNIKTTPLHLINNKIYADFTMGFASGPGFRAGTTMPFYYYDFNNENKTDLLFVPFCAMDGAYFVYENFSSEEAFTELCKIKNEIKKVNGLFTTVFHERTFDDHLYPGYGMMYKKLLLSE